MSPSIVISNVSENERLPHPLVVLDGHVTDFHELGLQQSEWFIDARLDATRGAFWPVTATGHFKALVLLPEPGSFTVTLRIGEYCVREFYITYEPPVSRHVVRFYYQKSCDAYEGEGFDAPPGVDNSDQAAIMKIRFNAMMLQTAAAEMLVRAGLKRKTFALEFGADGLPHVHLLRTNFSNREARRIHDQQLIKLIEDDIVANGFDTHDTLKYKHAVILGCSTWNPSTQKAEGHTALGGGNVGIFGSCGLHTWPCHLGEVSSHFLNNTRIDTNRLMDDSAYRGTYWANYSTGIGAFIHELGHTFGLGHSVTGIMGRGFDDMNRLFCAFEADHKRYEPAFFQDFYDGRLVLNHQVIREVKSPGGAHWNMGSALQLMHCPWISHRPKESQRGPLICWSSNVRGPVGDGSYNGEQKMFMKKPLSAELGAVCIKSNAYVEKIKSYTREEVYERAETKMRSKKYKHWVVLAPGEYITQVKVRAAAWIDGLRIYTNLRATRWFGGFGGQAHMLRADDGHKINGFFGTRGDNYVGRLGVYCEPVSSPVSQHQHGFKAVPEYMETVPPLGGGLSEGPHSGFDFRSTPIGAIVIKCDEFVESIRVVSPGEHAVATRDTESGYYDSDELVFDLLEGEYIERVSIRSGHWIDAVQLHTNLRSSPWFGGKGGGRSEIECPPGHRVCGLHGRRGYYYVDLLGLYTCANDRCHSAPSAAESNTVQVGPVGVGEQDGTQHAFSTVNGTADLELGAIFVEAQDFVSRVWTYSKRDVAAMGQGGFHSHGQRQWFVLGTDEYVTRVEVRAMCWLGGLRVHTDKRSSPWYGGNGGQLQSLEPPAGFKIHGFFGSTGNSFVGKLGAYCSPIPGHSEVYEQRAISGSAVTISGPTHFSLLDASDRMGHLAHSGVARGVLVAVHIGVVMKVSTFDCVETKTHEVQQLQCFVCAGAQVHCFSLLPGEMLVQVDISVTQPPPSHTHEFAHHQHQGFSIEGICFHTTSRCSSWFGSYTDSQLRFFAAPTGAVIKSIIGVPGTLSVQDIVGEFMPHATAILHSSSEIDGYNHLEGAIEDPGTYDIRVKSQSSHGIESVLLLKNRNEELLDEHAWMWRKSSTAPLTWCLPQRMLEHHIAYTAEEQGVTPREYLFSKCALGAMDVGGAYSKSGPPPSAY